MKKSKLLKALLVFGMSVVTAASVAGITACGNEHDHVDEDQDGKCDICAIDMPSGGDNEGGNQGGNEGGNQGGNQGGNEGGNQGGNQGGDNDNDEDDNTPAVTNEYVKFNVSDLTKASYAAGEELIEGSGIYTVSALVPEAETATVGKKIYYAGEEITPTKRIKYGSTVSETANALKIVVTAESAKIIAYGYSGSNGTDRSLRLLDSTGKTLDTQSIGKGNNYMGTAIFEVTEGTYFIGSGGSTAYIYYVAVVGDINEVKTHVDADPATCDDAGIVEHSKTNFGRYYNTNNELIAGSDTVDSAKGHNYTTYTVTKLPGATADGEPGVATATCSRDSSHTTEITLPVLTEADVYERVENADDSSKYDYSYEDQKTGLTITFTADKVDAVEVQKDTFTADFAGNTTKFATNTVYGPNNATGLTAIEDTGLYCTKSSNTAGTVMATQASTNILKLQGTASTTQNSIAVHAGAGVTTITIKYFQSAGRYIDVFNSAGTVIADSSSKPTTGTTANDIITYTFTITLTEADTLYFGSHSSGMYVSYIQVVTPHVDTAD